MGALGYAWYVPDEEKHLRSKKELEERIITALAGRAAEELIFDSITTGASNDIEQATNLARNMVTLYGMSDKFGLMQLEGVEDQYLTGRKVLNCSDETAARVDEEVMKILADSYEEAKRLLSENRELMEELANFLLEKESITGKEFMKIFRAEKGIPEPEEEEKDVTGTERSEESKDASEEKPSEETLAEKTPEEEKEENSEEPEKKVEAPEAPQGDTGIFSNHTIM
jgi:cell division protease FtsH